MASRPPGSENFGRPNARGPTAERIQQARADARAREQDRAAAREFVRTERVREQIENRVDRERRWGGDYFGLSEGQARRRETSNREEIEFSRRQGERVRARQGTDFASPARLETLGVGRESLPRAAPSPTPSRSETTSPRERARTAAARPRERSATATAPSSPSPAATAASAQANAQPSALEANTLREPLTMNPVVADIPVSAVGTSIPQVFDINSFRSEIIQNDVLPAHSYLVTFSPFRAGFPENAPLTEFVTNKRNTLMMRCENVVLPTPSFLEEENIRRYGYGPTEKVPYGMVFSDVVFTWLVDKNSEIVDFFHQWMNTIVMHDSPNTLMNASAQRDGLQNYRPYEVGFKDAYTNPIVRVYVYNRRQQTVTEYEMYDVFPMNIQSMNLSWAEENQVQKLTVTFSYINMKVKAPLKSQTPQYNFFEEGRTSPYEERQLPSDRGGRAAADRADSPFREVITTTANVSIPEAQAAIDYLANTSTFPPVAVSGPTERDLT